MLSHGYDPDSQSALGDRLPRRWLLALPPLLLLLSGVGMAIAAPFAWGAGNRAGLADWMPAFSAALFAAPAVYISARTLLQVRRETGREFSVFSLQLLLGIFLFVVLAVIELALAFRVAEPRTYDSLLDENGEVATSPAAFLLITLVGTVFATAWLSVGAFLYANGIAADGSRFMRRLDEPDLMDELLRGQWPRL
jgi:hypothetical protein